MTRDDAEAYTRKWIAAWNARDVDAVVQGFADDATFRSPLAGDEPVRGRAALREYWSGVKKYESFRFTLDRMLWDDERQELAIVYTAEADGRRTSAAEILRFDANGLVVVGEAMYGVGNVLGRVVGGGR